MSRVWLTSDLHVGYNRNTHIVLEKFYTREKDKLNDDDILVFAGDSISHKQESWKSFFNRVNRFFPNNKKLLVLGNHDYWGARNSELDLKKYTNGNGNWLIPNSDSGIATYNTKDTIYILLNNWYYKPEEASKKFNDISWMDYYSYQHIGREARKRERKVLTKLNRLKEDSRDKVLISHFGPENYYDPDHFDSLLEAYSEAGLDQWLTGHTHRYHLFIKHGVICTNSGSDYNNPKAIFLHTGDIKNNGISTT